MKITPDNEKDIPQDITFDNTVIIGMNKKTGNVAFVKEPGGEYISDVAGGIKTANVVNSGGVSGWGEWQARAHPNTPTHGFVLPSDAHKETTIYNSSEVNTWIDYDVDLQRNLQDAYEQSYSNKGIIDQKINFTIGGGLSFAGQAKSSTAEEKARWEFNKKIATNLGLFKIINEAVFQYINYGNCCVYATKNGIIDHWKVKYSRIETNGKMNLSNMQIAFSKDRSFQASTTSRAPIYPNFGTIETNSFLNERGEIQRSTDEATVFFLKNLKGDREYWALPSHNAGLLLYKTQYYISRYQSQAFVRGLMPKYLVVFYGEDQTALDKKRKEFEKSTNGLENSHVPLFLNAVGEKEHGGIEIIDLTRRNEGEFLELENSTRQGIYQTHQFPPSLASQEVAGKLGNAKELKDSYTLVYNTMIRIYQQQFIDDLILPLFELLDKKYQTTFIKDFLGIKDAPPITLTDENVLTTREKRDGQGFGDMPLPNDNALNILLDIPINLIDAWLKLRELEARVATDTNPNPNPNPN